MSNSDIASRMPINSHRVNYAGKLVWIPIDEKLWYWLDQSNGRRAEEAPADCIERTHQLKIRDPIE